MRFLKPCPIFPHGGKRKDTGYTSIPSLHHSTISSFRTSTPLEASLCGGLTSEFLYHYINVSLHRGKTGGHHISLYVEKFEKVIRILIISKTINFKRSNFFSILSGDSVSSYSPSTQTKLVF